MYIINPLYIYLIDIIPKIGLFFGIIGGFLIVASGLALFSWIEDFEEIGKKLFPRFLVFGIIFILLTIITPSKETLTTMLVAKCLTVENVEKIGETGKDIVDYMFEKVDELQKSKNE